MRKAFNKAWFLVMRDIQENKFQYFLVVILLVCAFILRVWRIDQLLGFYFDQGRDALAVNEILQGNLTLIGPTTAIEGIFLGPFYYYILAVGYLIGQGSPVIASYWQTLIILLGYFVIFLIARIYFSLRVGLITLFLMTFSFSQIKLDRWLSNPTPTMLFSPLVMLFLLLSFKSPEIFLPLTAFFSGILLQLEASSSFALMLITLIFIFVFRKKFTIASIAFSVVAFFITLLPQIIFEIKHNFLITKSFLNFLNGNVQTEGQSTFRIPIDSTFQNRVDLYSITFLEKLKLNYDLTFSFMFVIFLIVSLYIVVKNWSNPAIKLIAFWFYGLLLFFLFYSGNYGIINNYYFFPVFPIFFILIALILNWMLKKRFFIPVVIILLAYFLYDQLPMSLSYISSGVEGDTTIALGNQAKAVEYIINDSGKQDYNWDAYVPPVIPYTYTYLFKYYGNRYNRMPSEEATNNLYTIHEVDISIPERESAWLKRQDEIGTIIDTKKFGGITVEKRQRIN